MDTIYWLIAAATLSYFIYKWSTIGFDYFLKRGIAHKKPIPLFGNFSPVSLFKSGSMTDFMLDTYRQFPKDKVVGLFNLRTPAYILRDPELIRRVTVKDFDHFTDHKDVLPRVSDNNDDIDLFFSSLIATTGQKWKNMRSTLSPAFTGSKMRQMFELVNDCGAQVINYFNREMNNSGKANHAIDVKDVFSKFTVDVIATCAFGIKVDTFEDQDNEFHSMGKKVTTPTARGIFKIFLMTLAPRLGKFLKLTILDTNVEKFFKSMILDTMRIRERDNIVRPDMINLLIAAKKGKLNNDESDTLAEITENAKVLWTDNELVAQCLLFFIGGFDTTSNALSFTAYELAANPRVQQKLIEEIDEVAKSTNGSLSYNDVQSMKYMEMVLSEGLRKWPPAPMTDRLCLKNYAVNDDCGRNYVIEKGIQVMVPIYALHYDSEYFENPEEFVPERFSEERIQSIVPGTYLPFGMGPRSCIASRFALMTIKTVLYHVLREYTFEVCDKTLNPMTMGKFTVVPQKGIHLELKRREIV